MTSVSELNELKLTQENLLQDMYGTNAFDIQLHPKRTHYYLLLQNHGFLYQNANDAPLPNDMV